MLRSVRLSLSIVGLVGCMFASVAAHADVYKYKDEKGNVLYTDKPQYLPAERLSIKSDNTNIVDLDQRNDEENTAQADREATRKDSKESSADRKKSKEGKAEACTKARQDYLARMNAPRLYEEGPKGEKRYLSEKELEAARSAAKQAMDALCN